MEPERWLYGWLRTVNLLWPQGQMVKVTIVLEQLTCMIKIWKFLVNIHFDINFNFFFQFHCWFHCSTFFINYLVHIVNPMVWFYCLHDCKIEEQDENVWAFVPDQNCLQSTYPSTLAMSLLPTGYHLFYPCLIVSISSSTVVFEENRLQLTFASDRTMSRFQVWYHLLRPIFFWKCWKIASSFWPHSRVRFGELLDFPFRGDQSWTSFFLETVNLENLWD